MSKHLWQAIKFRNIGSLQILLDFGEDINSKDENNWTLLEYTIQHNLLDIADFLIEKGADINLNNPISLRVSSQALSVTQKLILIQKLIDWGADIQYHRKHKDRFSLLYSAIHSQQTEIAKLLINAGSPINEIIHGGKTAVEIAATYGNSDLVKWLLEQGAKKSLHIAVAVGDTQQVKKYLASGGDPNARLGDGYGCPPIYVAAANNQLKSAALLIEARANLNLECEQDDFAILAACRYASCDMVKFLIDNGVRTDVYGSISGLIGNAASTGNLSVIRFLVEELNFLDSENKKSHNFYYSNCLAVAASNGFISIVQYLFSKGVSIPEDAIVLAARHGHNEVVRWLVEHNCNLNSTLHGKTALYEAIRAGHITTVEILLRLGAKLDLGLKTGEPTELYYAAYDGNLEIVKLLVRAGANVNAWLGYIETPIECAGERRADDVIEFLIQHGAKG